MGCRLWGRTESDTTEVTQQQQQQQFALIIKRAHNQQHNFSVLGSTGNSSHTKNVNLTELIKFKELDISWNYDYIIIK